MNNFLLPLVMLAMGLAVGYLLGLKRQEKGEDILQPFRGEGIKTSGWRVAFLRRDGQTRMTGEMNLREAILRISKEEAGAYICKVTGVVWKDEIPTPQTILKELEIEIESN